MENESCSSPWAGEVAEPWSPTSRRSPSSTRTFRMAAKRQVMPHTWLTASGPSAAAPSEGIGTGPDPAPAFQETENSQEPSAQGRERHNWSIPGGRILFAAPSSGQERTNSAAAQLCANEIEADKAATCQAAPSAAPSTSLLRRGSAPFRETAMFPQAVSR